MALCAALAWPAQGQTPSFDELALRAAEALDSRPAEAAGLYRQALAIRPDWAQGWLYLGASLYQVERYAEATHAFRKGIALSPRLGTAWAFLGLCEAELDNAEQALADIRKGESLGLGGNPQFEVAVRVTAAQILIRTGDFAEALAQLQPIALRNENSRPVVETMGLCALGVASSLRELSAARRAAVYQAGKAAWALANQHPAEAAAAYRLLLEQYPGEPGVRHAYGLYLMETDMKAALAQFREEVRNNPQHWPSLIVIASLEIRQGATSEAMQSLQQAMKFVPPRQRWICRAEMGRANLVSDNLEAAITEFETAVRWMPTNAQLRFLLAQAYRRAGRKEDAERENAEFQRLKVREDPLGVPVFRPLATPGGKG